MEYIIVNDSVKTVRFASLQCSCEWILIFYVAKEYIGRFRTGLEPLVTLLRFQVMPLLGTFFKARATLETGCPHTVLS